MLTRALWPGAFLADWPYCTHGRQERDAQQAADVLRHSGQEARLTVVPRHHALRSEGWTAMVTHFAADWFHPNDAGHRVWAAASGRLPAVRRMLSGSGSYQQALKSPASTSEPIGNWAAEPAGAVEAQAI